MLEKSVVQAITLCIDRSHALRWNACEDDLRPC